MAKLDDLGDRGGIPRPEIAIRLGGRNFDCWRMKRWDGHDKDNIAPRGEVFKRT
jgi:hypothetical protein